VIPELLVVAGEASGDAMAAPVVEALGVPAFGVGGVMLERARVELVADVSELAVMGLGSVLAKAPTLLRRILGLRAEIVRRRPRVALLVGYSELNTRLGRFLRRRGCRVLFYSAPQIWAWRPWRARSIARACDRMAVILPFEEALWRSHGVDAHYVGHAALETPGREARAELRQTLGLDQTATSVALLPGSRAAEVERHLDLFLATARALSGVETRLIAAPALPYPTRDWLGRRSRSAGVRVVTGPARELVAAFDAALAVSGTVTLECALAGTPPVIVYAAGPVTELLAKALLSVEHIGLPNLLLAERAYPELVGKRLDARALARELRALLANPVADRSADLRRVLENGRPKLRPSASVAELIRPWLARR